MASNITGKLWVPTSEAEISTAVGNRTFAENHWLDAKAETGDSDGAKKETARDIAAFANDGGVLVIGVSEDKANQTFRLSPIPLKGGAEKIEQIAQTRLQPPLGVRVTQIPSAQGAGTGYLVVEIPASSDRPHMVDGRYLVRDGTTKRQLSDQMVELMMAERRATRHDLRNRLSEIHDADGGARLPPSLYFIADPIAAPHDLALDLVRENPPTTLDRITFEAARSVPQDNRRTEPLDVHLHDATDPVSAHRGIGRASYPDDNGIREVERRFYESGRLEVIVRNINDDIDVAGKMKRRINDQHVVFWVTEALAALSAIVEALEFHGSWRLSLLLTGIDRMIGLSAFAGYPMAHHGDEYFETTLADAKALEANRHDIVRALLAPLLRDLEVDRRVFLPTPSGDWARKEN